MDKMTNFGKKVRGWRRIEESPYFNHWHWRNDAKTTSSWEYVLVACSLHFSNSNSQLFLDQNSSLINWAMHVPDAKKTECFYFMMTILYYLQWFNNKNDNGSGMLEITITKGRSFFFDRFDWQNYFNLLYVLEDILTKISSKIYMEENRKINFDIFS